MTQLESIIESICETEKYEEKLQLLSLSYQMLKGAPGGADSLGTASKNAIISFALSEFPVLIKLISQNSITNERDNVIEYANGLVHMIMLLCPNADELSETDRNVIGTVAALIEQEHKIENAAEELFKNSKIDAGDIERFFSLPGETPDDHGKLKIYNSILQFEREINSKLTKSAKELVASYLLKDIRARLTDELSGDALHAMEIGADLVRYFANDELLSALVELTKRGFNNVNCYAVRSLVSCGREIPSDVIVALAKDLEYAMLTYEFLEHAGKEELFPAEYRTPEYLAKSDMVHWLCYPTELGKAPDEIEYIGKVKKLFRKEVFYVFKFRSNSYTLSDDIKGKWLIGWSGSEDGTFSNFDEYAKYEKPTIEATLKNIQKRLIG